MFSICISMRRFSVEYMAYNATSGWNGDIFSFATVTFCTGLYPPTAKFRISTGFVSKVAMIGIQTIFENGFKGLVIGTPAPCSYEAPSKGNAQRARIFFDAVFFVAKAGAVGRKGGVFIAAVQVWKLVNRVTPFSIFHQIALHNGPPVLGRFALR